MSRFAFGRSATRRPPREPQGEADLFVLGVYPSALHVRWTSPAGGTVGALAVDDEPVVFWDGADADERVRRWREAVGWTDEWGTVTRASGNGSSGRHVVRHVLDPLGVDAAAVFFTDCLPLYFVKEGPGSQGARLRAVYDPFASSHHGLQPADLPRRPPPAELVRRAVAEEGQVLRHQLLASGSERVVTLGQEAADVLAAITGHDRVLLDTGPDYGTRRRLRVEARDIEWIPLTHPGNRAPIWATRHALWGRHL